MQGKNRQYFGHIRHQKIEQILVSCNIFLIWKKVRAQLGMEHEIKRSR